MGIVIHNTLSAMQDPTIGIMRYNTINAWGLAIGMLR